MYFDVRHFLVCCVVYIRTVCCLHTCLLMCYLQELKIHFSQKHSVRHQMSFIWKLRPHSSQLWNCNYWIFQHLHFLYEGLTWWWHECFRLTYVVNFCVSDTEINCCLNDNLSVCSSCYSFLEVMFTGYLYSCHLDTHGCGVARTEGMFFSRHWNMSSCVDRTPEWYWCLLIEQGTRNDRPKCTWVLQSKTLFTELGSHAEACLPHIQQSQILQLVILSGDFLSHSRWMLG